MTDTPEIERIRAALVAYDAACYYDLPQYEELQDACSPHSIRRVIAHIDAQAAEIERLRADANRYQWLLSTADNDIHTMDSAVPTLYVGDAKFSGSERGSRITKAIDAAMAMK